MKQALIGISSGLVVGVLVLVLLILGPLKPEPVQTALPTQEASSSPAPSPTETVEEVPTCSISEFENDPLIDQLQAEVLDAATGEVLFERSPAVASRAASVQKVMTAAAALKVLGPDYQVVTRVFADKSDPSILYFVGAGDPTLSRLNAGSQSVYRNAPKLQTLAQDVLKKTKNVVVSKIVLDSSLYGGESGEYLDVWDSRGLSEGYMSFVSALQVDGDRDKPANLSSPRSNDPVLRAGEWFRDSLGSGAKNAVLEKGVVPLDAVEIAKISSRPISEWINYMLKVSDNTLAEALGRLIALDLGLDGSFESIDQGISLGLSGLGLDLTGMQLDDASGLSRYNQLPPSLVNDVLVLAKQDTTFQALVQGLPVSGESGSLSGRFVGLEGLVRAKSGWIRTGYTLAGYLTARDGAELVFTVYNLSDSVSLENREAMDRLVAGIQACGLELSNE